MPTSRPSERPLDGLLRRASPDGDLLAQRALGELEARLFGKPRATVHIGRYILEDRIGVGGGGAVHRASDPKHGRKVALKLLHAEEGARYEEARDRLLREAQSLAKLAHPNVVRIYDVGTYDPAVFDPSGASSAPTEGVYLAMELLDGCDLEQWLQQAPRGWQEVRDVFVSAGRGLAAAHARGMIHRDFKPANVSIDASGHVRVLDFGLARPTTRDIPDPSLGMTEGAQQRLDELARPLHSTLTAPGTLLGTPAYMAPEQHERQRATALSDQYSLCLSLYEAWYGYRPFLADSEQELSRLKREGNMLPPPDDTEVPPRYFQVLLRGLSPRPAARFESMDALLAALTASPTGRGHAWRRGLAGALGLGAVVAGGLWLGARADSTPACETAPWSERWGEAEARTLRESAASRLGPETREAAETIASELLTWVDEAERFEAERCQAEPTRSAPADDCARRRYDRLSTLAQALPTADGPALVRVAQWMVTVPPIVACTESTPGAPAGPPANPVAETLDHARMLAALGRTTDALELARQAHAQSAQQERSSGLLEAAALHGHLALDADARPEAEQALTDALWSEGARTTEAASLLAAVDLLELARRESPRPADTSLWILFAREHAAMADVPTPVRLRLYLGLGRLAAADGDVRRASTDLLQGLELPVSEGEADVVLALREALDELESPPR
ncbi:MAG: serine/threonine-protein kinase [Nannocystaceae bacterium]